MISSPFWELKEVVFCEKAELWAGVSLPLLKAKSNTVKIATIKTAAIEICHRFAAFFEAFITFFDSSDVMQYKQKEALSSISALQ